MTKQIILSAIFLFISVPLFCQTRPADSMATGSPHFFQPRKFDYGLTLGSEFTSISGFGSGLNTYVTPRISYNVSKRFSVGGGFSIIQTNYFGAKPYLQNEQNTFSNGNFTSAVLFVSGQYLVNERLTIYGSAFKQFQITQDPLPYNPFNPVSKNGAQGINFNVSYRIGKNVMIQGSFRYSEGMNPYNCYGNYNDPFHSGSFIPGGGFGR